MSREIYLDYAAATPLDKRVFLAMEPYLSAHFYNPSSSYSPAREVKRDYDAAKHSIAQLIGAKRDELIMTAGATESINLAFHGVLQPDDNVVIGAIEHPSVYAVAAGYQFSLAKSTTKGVITPEAVSAAVKDTTKLVSITAADSEIGVVQSLGDIARELEKIRDSRRRRGINTPLYFHTDASQAVGMIDLHVARLGVDMLTLNAAKCYGPKQVGLLWVSSRVKIQPSFRGGGQERGLRSGTENVAGVIGFSVAMRLAVEKRHTNVKKLRELRLRLQNGLTKSLPDMVINGHSKKHLPGIINISHPSVDGERVVMHLDMKGLYCSTGAACAANKGTRSKALEAIGLSPELADGSLRLSLGKYTTEEEIDRAITLITEAVTAERGL